VTLQQLLGIELPIIQAPMAGAQGHALAAAVSNAGGLGSLPCALLDPKTMRKELEALAQQTNRPYNVNFFCHQPPVSDAARETAWRAALSPYFQELGVDAASVPTGPLIAPIGADTIDVLAEFRPAVVSFHFGLPGEDLLARVRALGARIISSATTVAEARWLEAHGVDAIVAQGLEAGGHRGMFLSEDPTTQLGTFALLPQVVRAVRVPVVAAGGIADARGVAAAMALGAAGVQVGTAFLLCPEATPNAIYRAALKGEAATHTALTNVLSGRLARAISNRVVRELGPISANAPAFPLALGPILALRAKAEGQGSHEFSALWCGQNASGCKEIPAAELTHELGARRAA
jgi:nitronate monooxygenase